MLDEDGDREGSKDTRHPRGEGSGWHSYKMCSLDPKPSRGGRRYPWTHPSWPCVPLAALERQVAFAPATPRSWMRLVTHICSARQPQLGEPHSNARQTQIAGSARLWIACPAVLQEAKPRSHPKYTCSYLWAASDAIGSLPLALQGQLCACSLFPQVSPSEILTVGGTEGLGASEGRVDAEGYLEGGLFTDLEFSIPLKLTWWGSVFCKPQSKGGCQVAGA